MRTPVRRNPGEAGQGGDSRCGGGGEAGDDRVVDGQVQDAQGGRQGAEAGHAASVTLLEENAPE